VGRHSAVRAADLIAAARSTAPAPPRTDSPDALAARRRHAAPKPLWRRAHVVPTAAVAVCLLVGADALHLTTGIGHADALNKTAADVSGTDLSALASPQQAQLLARNGRVSRSSRTITGSNNANTSLARPGLPAFDPGKTVPGTWVRPSAGGESSCFCMRWGVMHEGIDLAGPLGSPIVAAGDGVVIDAGPAEGFGLWVVIQHDNGDVTIYGHMYHYYVTVGEHVSAGQHIADIGANGQATGPHLHFGVRLGGPNGPYVDPVPWLRARGVEIGPYNPNA